MRTIFAASAVLAVMAYVPQGHAQSTVTVDAAANIYGAGQKSAPGPGGGELPPFVVVPKHTKCITVTAVTGSDTANCASGEGCITIDNNEHEGTHWNDPDGTGAYPPTTSNTGYNSVSGITAPYGGYLVGLFTTGKKPKGATPPALDFTTGSGTSFTSLAPLLNQTFFVGDGLTGDGSGTVQTFAVPPKAKALYLGISDACGFNGGPGCYIDNVGSYTETVTTSTAPCAAIAAEALLAR